MMKKIANYTFYCILGILSFLFFLYLSFPYQALKESVLSKASNAFGSRIEAADLSPSFPLGILLSEIKVYNPGVSGIELKKAEISVNPFYLFLGKISINQEFEDQRQGKLEVSTKIRLLDLIDLLSDKNIFPTEMHVTSNMFNVGDFINFFIEKKIQDKNINLLLVPVLESITVKGKINSKINLQFDSADLSHSQGSMEIDFIQSGINFDDSMALTNQVFKKSKLKAKLTDGLLQIDRSSKLQSDQMVIAVKGSLKQKESVKKSVLDFNLSVELKDVFKTQLSFMLNIIAGRTTNGKLQVIIHGPISRPRIRFQ